VSAPAHVDDVLDAALAAASGATAPALLSTREQRATWLAQVAEALEAEGDALVAIAIRETHLGETRLRGELTRTTNQLRLFAEVILEGSYLEATVDEADATATPPRPEIRRMLRPLGPVAVFSASNFPFAFSVAGGDTASALAAGCPVIVKAHSGHPELSRQCARIVSEALTAAGAPAGMFGMVEGRRAGLDLAAAAPVQAVAFTGSLSGGRALLEVTSTRPDPIPFFGELGSVNPVVITPGADRARARERVSGRVESVTLGGGQFCTKPGVVFAPTGFAERGSLTEQVAATPGYELLTERITDAFAPSISRLRDAGDVIVHATGGGEGARAQATVLRTSIENFAGHADELLEECFGPLTLIVEYDALETVQSALSAVTGSLTATVHAEPNEDVNELVQALSARAGRVLFAGWPTGVAVTWGQHHGGPWPATTSAHTSVGATAIRRFLRPIAYQSAPATYLPADLTDGGLAALPHRREGRMILPS